MRCRLSRAAGAAGRTGTAGAGICAAAACGVGAGCCPTRRGEGRALGDIGGDGGHGHRRRQAGRLGGHRHLDGHGGGTARRRARNGRHRWARRGRRRGARLAFVGRRLGICDLATRNAHGVVGDAALGQHLRLLDPVLPVDAVCEAEGLADALDVGLHPGRDLLVAVNAQLVEAGLRLGVDLANALEVLRGRHGDWEAPPAAAAGRAAPRAASEAGRPPISGEARPGERLPAQAGRRRRLRRARRRRLRRRSRRSVSSRRHEQAPPPEAGDELAPTK